jgi:hypothetical protein
VERTLFDGPLLWRVSWIYVFGLLHRSPNHQTLKRVTAILSGRCLIEVQKQQQVFHNLNERIKELKAIHKGVRVVQDSAKSFGDATRQWSDWRTHFQAHTFQGVDWGVNSSHSGYMYVEGSVGRS